MPRAYLHKNAYFLKIYLKYFTENTLHWDGRLKKYIYLFILQLETNAKFGIMIRIIDI